jgi:hypothetical protein
MTSSLPRIFIRLLSSCLDTGISLYLCLLAAISYPFVLISHIRWAYRLEDGWRLIYRKGIYVCTFRMAKHSHLFKIFSQYTNIIFPSSWQCYWRQLHKSSCPDCTASTGHRVWVHHQSEIFTLLSAPPFVQTYENRWGLNQGCKKYDRSAHGYQCRLAEC